MNTIFSMKRIIFFIFVVTHQSSFAGSIFECKVSQRYGLTDKGLLEAMSIAKYSIGKNFLLIGKQVILQAAA